jgi:hypothetical protein
MMGLKSALALSLCLALSTISLAADNWVVREDGVGPVKIGMSLDKLKSIFHDKLSLPADKDSQSCFYVSSTDHPHVNFMIADGSLIRIDVDGPGIPTKEGVQVGDSEAHAMKTYGGKLKVEPREYVGPEAHYLTMRSSDGLKGTRFETNEGKVEMYYVGTNDAVHQEDGCQ